MKSRHKPLWLSIKHWFLRCYKKSTSNRRNTDEPAFILRLQEHSQESEKTACRLLLLFSRRVVSDSLRPHGLQHTRLPCPLLSPRVCSHARPLSWCCSLTVFSSAHQVAKAQTGGRVCKPCIWSGACMLNVFWKTSDNSSIKTNNPPYDQQPHS